MFQFGRTRHAEDTVWTDAFGESVNCPLWSEIRKCSVQEDFWCTSCMHQRLWLVPPRWQRSWLQVRIFHIIPTLGTYSSRPGKQQPSICQNSAITWHVGIWLPRLWSPFLHRCLPQLSSPTRLCSMGIYACLSWLATREAQEACESKTELSCAEDFASFSWKVFCCSTSCNGNL